MKGTLKKMAYYRYRGRNKQGDMIAGTLEASNERSVVQTLARLHITPVAIELGVKVDKFLWARWLPMLRPSYSELAFFSKQMHSLLKAGVPVNRALQVVIESNKNYYLVNALTNVLLDLESGNDLARCFQKQSWLFPDFFTSMVNIGEQTGKLDEVFGQIYIYLQTEQVTQKRVKNATRYPLFVLGAIVFALIMINFVVVPSFKQFFGAFGAELPWATTLLIKVSQGSIQGWPYLIGLAVIGFACFFYLSRQPQYRYYWDAFKLRLPVVGWILHRSLLARFVRSLALAHKSGLPLLEGIQLVGESMNNEYMSVKILKMRQGLEHGEELSQTAKNTGIFSELVVQMLKVAEETGNVEANLYEIASFYETDVDYDIKRLNDLLEPVLISIIAVMVLILALGVFLPLWDLSTVAMHRMQMG